MVNVICHCALQTVRHSVNLHIDTNLIVTHLLVLIYEIDRLVVVRHRIFLHLCGIRIKRNRTEEFLDNLLRMVNVHVAYYDDSLIVWTIPFLVVLAQCVVFEVIYHAHKSERMSNTPLRTGKEPWIV